MWSMTLKSHPFLVFSGDELRFFFRAPPLRKFLDPPLVSLTLSFSVSVSLSVCLSVCHSVCLCICLRLSVCLSVCLSLLLRVYVRSDIHDTHARTQVHVN